MTHHQTKPGSSWASAVPVALKGTCAVRTSGLPQVKSREASALRASRPPSELGVSLVHILTAYTSAVGASHPTLTTS